MGGVLYGNKGFTQEDPEMEEYNSGTGLQREHLLRVPPVIWRSIRENIDELLLKERVGCSLSKEGIDS